MPRRRAPLLVFCAVLLAFALCRPVLAWSPPQEATRLTALVPGTTLPVELQRSLQAGRTPVGTPVVAKTTQRVPIGPTLFLKRGAAVRGQVVLSANASGPARDATLTVRFTSLEAHGQTVPIVVDALAIANFTNVSDTAAPANGSTDRGNPNSANWTTQQIGGDEVYRSGWSGPVCNSTMRQVGFADFHGVYSLPAESPGGPGFALGVGPFSTSARGLYGFDPETSLRSAGGDVTISGPRGKAGIHAGDALLLRVAAP